jgi:hypothetical protein
MILWHGYKIIARPKKEGAWGLKNIHLFGKSLVVKILWNVIAKDKL